MATRSSSSSSVPPTSKSDGVVECDSTFIVDIMRRNMVLVVDLGNQEETGFSAHMEAMVIVYNTVVSKLKEQQMNLAMLVDAMKRVMPYSATRQSPTQVRIDSIDSRVVVPSSVYYTITWSLSNKHVLVGAFTQAGFTECYWWLKHQDQKLTLDTARRIVKPFIERTNVPGGPTWVQFTPATAPESVHPLLSSQQIIATLERYGDQIAETRHIGECKWCHKDLVEYRQVNMPWHKNDWMDPSYHFMHGHGAYWHIHTCTKLPQRMDSFDLDSKTKEFIALLRPDQVDMYLDRILEEAKLNKEFYSGIGYKTGIRRVGRDMFDRKEWGITTGGDESKDEAVKPTTGPKPEEKVENVSLSLPDGVRERYGDLITAKRPAGTCSKCRSELTEYLCKGSDWCRNAWMDIGYQFNYGDGSKPFHAYGCNGDFNRSSVTGIIFDEEAKRFIKLLPEDRLQRYLDVYRLEKRLDYEYLVKNTWDTYANRPGRRNMLDREEWGIPSQSPIETKEPLKPNISIPCN